MRIKLDMLTLFKMFFILMINSCSLFPFAVLLKINEGCNAMFKARFTAMSMISSIASAYSLSIISWSLASNPNDVPTIF
uniref:SFRICE041985.2 n=1 Tax=Spodoptera frugiperda TaxID=7108 RepID=A0A2H1VXL7_SPOFR